MINIFDKVNLVYYTVFIKSDDLCKQKRTKNMTTINIYRNDDNFYTAPELVDSYSAETAEQCLEWANDNYGTDEYAHAFC
jgi:hypothetical protein